MTSTTPHAYCNKSINADQSSPTSTSCIKLDLLFNGTYRTKGILLFVDIVVCFVLFSLIDNMQLI